jgi:hypothetical protein
VRLSKPLLSGVFFIGFGAFTLYAGKDLEMGTAGDMGTGYTPRLLALGLLGIGALLLLEAYITRRRDVTRLKIAVAPLLLVTAITVGFALLLPRVGLPIAVAMAVGAAAFSGERFRWPTLIVVAVGLAALTTLLFAFALRLQIPVWPT